jgi:uncharacterized membrane protein
MRGLAAPTASAARASARTLQREAPAVARRHGPFFVLVAVFAVLYGALVALRHERFQSHGYDLGIFDQAIWHYSQFQTPGSTIRGFPDLLGDHFHPIVALAAPALWIWDDVRALLLVQVALFLIAAVPVYLLGRQRFGQVAGLVWAAAFLLFWGVQSAIDFDFHEVAFAVPLIAWGLYLVLQRRFTAAAVCVALLLLVKEDLSFTVMGFGVVFLLYRRWWLGAGFLVGALGWFLIVTKLVMPALADGRPFQYWSYQQFGDDAVSAGRNVATHPWKLVTVAIDNQQKRNTGFVLLASWAFLPLASLPALVLCVPLIAERFLSTTPAYWGTGFHYSATISPVLALGAIDGLSKLRGWVRFDRRWAAAFAAVAAIPLALMVGQAFRSNYALERLTHGDQWSVPADARVGDRMLALIPGDASVTAQDALLPHLTHRAATYDLVPGNPLTDDVAINLRMDHYPTTEEQYMGALARFRRAGYGVVFQSDGWVLLARHPQGRPLAASPELQARWAGTPAAG